MAQRFDTPGGTPVFQVGPPVEPVLHLQGNPLIAEFAESAGEDDAEVTVASGRIYRNGHGAVRIDYAMGGEADNADFAIIKQPDGRVAALSLRDRSAYVYRQPEIATAYDSLSFTRTGEALGFPLELADGPDGETISVSTKLGLLFEHKRLLEGEARRWKLTSCQAGHEPEPGLFEAPSDFARHDLDQQTA